MNTFMISASLTSGAYLILISFVLDTHNVQSTVLFKVIPLFLGLGSLFVGLKLLGWI